MLDKNPASGPLGGQNEGMVTQQGRESGLTGNAGVDWRKLLASGLYRTGMLWAARAISKTHELHFSEGSRVPRLRKVTTPKFLILCYHRVGTGGVPIYSELSPQLFEAQMRFLRKHYRIVSLAEVCKGLQTPSGIGPSVAITFDDGYRDVYTQAFPILQKYGIPATVFLIADALETGNVAWYDRVFAAFQYAHAGDFPVQLNELRVYQLTSRQSCLQAAFETMSHLRDLSNEDRKMFCADLERRVELPSLELENKMMNWTQVQTMQNGGISFGSHTVTHPAVSRLSSAELEFEISESKRILEVKLGRTVEDFAYPFGQPRDCGNAAGTQLASSGYRSAVTTVTGINMPGVDLYGLRRVQVGPEHTLPVFSLFLNQCFLHANHFEVSCIVAGDGHPTAGSAERVSSIKKARHA